MQPRHRDPRPRGTQEGALPDRHKARFVVYFLLNLMQQSLALLRVALGDLLRVPGVNVGVAQKRLCPLTVHEGLDASRSIAKRPAALARQVLYRLLFLRRLDGGALHRAYLGPDTYSGEVVHDAFDHG